MLTLALDSSAKACSCAITQGGVLIAESFFDVGLTHSRTLIPMLEATLSSAEVKYSDIDRIAVSVGPGSFTGVRIGISAVKGLAFGLNIPCVGVPTLLGMAHLPLGFYEGYVCPVMDARAGQVYAALFELKSGHVQRVWDDTALSIDELHCKLPAGTLLMGDGAHLVLHSSKTFKAPPAQMAVQRASGVALAATTLPDMPPDNLYPIYLRRPQAEREYLKKHENTEGTL